LITHGLWHNVKARLDPSPFLSPLGFVLACRVVRVG
jgi:hypothetical protein